MCQTPPPAPQNSILRTTLLIKSSFPRNATLPSTSRRTSSLPPLAALAQVSSPQRQPFSLAHWITSRCPPAAAKAQVASFLIERVHQIKR